MEMYNLFFLLVLVILPSCINILQNDKEKEIIINEGGYVTIGNWNVMLKDVFGYSGTIYADLDIFSGKPIEGYEAPQPVSPKSDFQGYKIGDELNLENHIYLVIDIKMAENRQGYIILKKEE